MSKISEYKKWNCTNNRRKLGWIITCEGKISKLRENVDNLECFFQVVHGKMQLNMKKYRWHLWKIFSLYFIEKGLISKNFLQIEKTKPYKTGQEIHIHSSQEKKCKQHLKIWKNSQPCS